MVFRTKSFQCALLFVLWAAIYLGGLFRPAFFDDADTVHAEAVREMAASGDWITLKINNGIRYLEKAPFMYWMSALSVRLLGLSDGVVRLPVALFALFLTFLLYTLGNRFFGNRAAFYSALVYVTSLGPYAFTRILLPDVMLAFFIALAFYFYLRIVYDTVSPKKIARHLDPRNVGLFASVALAVLTKGLVGMVFVGTVIFAHILLTGRWEIFKRIQIFQGMVIFLLVAVPWHLIAGITNKGFLWFYFVNEHFLRYLGLRYPKDYDTVPLWLFWLLHLAWLFPWSTYFLGLRQIIPSTLRPKEASEQINQFLLLWILVILTFFSFSTTQEYYTFPTLPAFALLLGQVLARIDSPQGASEQRTASFAVAVLAGVGLIVGSGLFVLAWLGKGGAAAAGDVSSTLTVNPEQYALSFGHMLDLTPETFSRLSGLVYRTAFILLLGPLLALLATLRKRWSLSALCLALMMVGLLHSYSSGMVAFQPVLSSKGLAEVIQEQHQPGDMIFVNGVYERGSSINYYTHLQLSILNGHFGNLWYGSFFPDAPSIFYDDESFPKIWKSDQRVFLFSESGPLEAFLARHPDLEFRVLAEEGGKKVLVNW
ncbi:ArnT family glycosyltransferase [Desulforhabdus amnigena]|jgi:4-amino-4-deoxy-L-arabinose transferase-like glycosyltransferase|uniref:Glycosyltransferase RgtA/B/C/D-like domain-containing protein n=1 Tax=Desulforhabdus amnigena TaxID=40218 RepID=A0A9W6FWC3_9BACT|nr:glycosyltransferase family 39 protein [Desulforhabdus amnigena]NLJ29608.1 glycosyltransferase family 39 protein [Deltaproteobacteria bacterium]GLI36023.1 hypothetical protein DAMNIGENAA_34560 [Desulforhabdus amnigena]